MSITVYAAEILPGAPDVLHFGNSIEEVEKEGIEIFRDIKLEDGMTEMPPCTIYAFDLDTPKLEDVLAILNERKGLRECILRNRRFVKQVVVD